MPQLNLGYRDLNRLLSKHRTRSSIVQNTGTINGAEKFLHLPWGHQWHGGDLNVVGYSML